MAWQIKFRPSVIKELKKLSVEVQGRILSFLESIRGNPHSKGKAMKVGKAESPMWCYRVGDYRIICHLRDENVTVLVLRIAHRKDAYR